MKKRHNLMMTVMAMTVGLSLLTGCSSGQTAQSTVQSGTVSESGGTVSGSQQNLMEVSYNADDSYTGWENGEYTKIQLNGDTMNIEGTGAVQNGNILSITKGGTYAISGELSDGSIVIDSADAENVRVVLNGVKVYSSTTAPFYVKNAEKTIISLQSGTENTFSDGTSYVYEDAATDEPDSTIFSKDDLTINGTGTLTVQAAYSNGITSKDDLKIMEGTINITSVNHGIKGKDMVAIKDGNFTITAGGDGIKSTNTTDSTKGFVNIEGGTFNITAEQDGIQAETNVQIADGQFNIITNGGSSNGATHTEEGFGAGRQPGMGGAGMTKPSDVGITAPADEGMTVPPDAGTTAPADEGMTPPSDTGTIAPANEGSTVPSGAEMTKPTEGTAASESTADSNTDSTSESTSCKGIKAASSIFVSGGDFDFNTADDAVRSNDYLSISGGTMTIESGDDGIHSDTTLEISGGTIDITKSYEGIESSSITISGGDIKVAASDDGINVGGGNDGSAMGRPGENTFTTSDSSTQMLTISGGNVYVNASGDGLDSNGSITMTGGTVIVNGPENSGNGALDYDREFLMNGGTLIAAGSSGMFQGISTESEQPAVVMTFSNSSQQSGTLINLQDESGNTIVSFAPAKTYQAVIISSPEIEIGKTYSLSYGGSQSGTAVNGLYEEGAYTNGTSVGSFTLSDALTYLCETGVTTAPQGGMGGKGGMGGQGNMKGNGTRPNRAVANTTADATTSETAS